MTLFRTKPGNQEIYDKYFREQSHIHRLERHANVSLVILMESQRCTFSLVPFPENNGNERERNFGVVLEQSDWLILVCGPLN